MHSFRKLAARLVTEGVLRFLMSWVSSVVVVAALVGAIWPLWGVGPDRLLFWTFVAPLLTLVVLYGVINGVQRLRGVDITARKRAVASATYAELQRRYDGGSPVE